jgi:hypothetical protein
MARDPLDDIIGGDDIIGEDDEVGAVRNRAQIRSRAARGNSVMTSAQTLGSKIRASGERIRLLPLGRQAAVADGASTNLTGQPQKPIQPMALVLSSPDGTAKWGVTAFQVGVENQFVANGEMPAEAFDAKATVEIECDPLSTSMTALVTCINRAGAASSISGVLIGTAAK